MKLNKLFLLTVFFLFETTSAQEGKKIEFSYEGDTGPLKWGGLPNSLLCKEGKKQSPLNIIRPFIHKQLDLHFRYKGSQVSVLDNGHALEVRFDNGNALRVGEKTYSLLQMHIHSPSEHLLDGSLFELELHFVHKSKSGEYLVLAVFIEEGVENDFFKPLLTVINKTELKNKEISPLPFPVNPQQFLPTNNSVFIYEGSWTIPPCKEGVLWVVFRDSLKLSKKQIQDIKKIHSKNARPIQLRNKRTIHTQ